jgi:hypothetical protein
LRISASAQFAEQATRGPEGWMQPEQSA